jgi:hypothetical protein
LLHLQHSQQRANDKKISKLIFNLLNIKKIYFNLVFCGKKRRMLKNIFLDRFIENKIFKEM